MFKGIIFSLTLIASGVGFAAPSVVDVLASATQQQVLDQVNTMGLNFKVGDTNNYSMDMGFIKGTMVMLVREIGADGVWIDQNADLGFAGKQNMSILIDPNTGETKKMLVNGKEQAVPKNNTEVVDVKEDKITVPAGTFECMHATIKNKDDGKLSNAWINPQLVGVSGMIKMIAPTQLGDMTVLLTSFKKN